ncbi:restriction endonuclease subunit S [Micrococcus terreus]|uniref:restriction endonuclease subunit S n=1 Tax=Micrococcus terreus TaxID=574650 RepID=UPI003D70FE65
MIAGWTETRLGHLVRFRSGDAITSQSIESHGTYPVFGGNGRRGYAEDFNVDGDSILVGRVGALCGNVHRYVGKARVSEHALIAYPLVDWNRRWMAYLLDSMNLGQWSTGTAQPVLTAATLERLRVIVPSTGMQARIADYLDRETATIDALIEKQMSLIAGLIERRRASISKSVVTGLHGSAVRCTRDTYFPRIADTWQLQPLGYGYDVVLGKMLDAKRASQDGDTELPYVRAANIKDGYLDLEDVNSMAYTPYEVMRLDLRAGDLLVVEGGSVGQSALLKEPMSGWSFQKTVNRVRSRRQWSTAYLHYVLSHMRARGHFDLICSGSTIAHLTAEKLRAIKIPVPPPAEQREIAGHLDRETAKIDALIAKAERFIELARERRAALITAAVTGQIEIPT